MATPRVEEIEQAILTALEGISSGAGDNYDYVQVDRKLKQPDQVNEFPVLFCPPGKETGEELVEGTDRELLVPIWGYHNTEDAVAQLNKIRQDVEKALFADGDVTLGLDYVTGMSVQSVDRWQKLGANTEAIHVLVKVKYRYNRGNP